MEPLRPEGDFYPLSFGPPGGLLGRRAITSVRLHVVMEVLLFGTGSYEPSPEDRLNGGSSYASDAGSGADLCVLLPLSHIYHLDRPGRRCRGGLLGPISPRIR